MPHTFDFILLIEPKTVEIEVNGISVSSPVWLLVQGLVSIYLGHDSGLGTIVAIISFSALQFSYSSSGELILPYA